MPDGKGETYGKDKVHSTRSSIDRRKDRVRDKGERVQREEIQEILELLCPQSIYKWMHGRSMPSIDNLYMLHRLFNVHMEDMLVPRDMS